EQALSELAGVLRVELRLELEELLDVGAGDEDVLLAGGDDHGADRAIRVHHAEDPLEIGAQRAIHLVDRIAGLVDRNDEDSVRLLCPKALGHVARSTTIACPMPPAAQTVMSPNCPPRLASSFTSVMRMRPPVAPNGCPIEIEPPMTLSFSRSTSPTGFVNPARSAQARDSSPLRLHSTCAANASCISTRSM